MFPSKPTQPSLLNRISLQHPYTPFTTTKTTFKMPLVVPGITSEGGGDKTQEWSNKLVGKKLGDVSDAVTFAKADLPKETRVITKNTMVTKDFRPDRLNVHVNDDGTVSHVNHQ
ncbi:hypothetical protein HYALB_00001062 [Hymenoscyphus albidus]|uniref:Uncharacterized protein n=1 Tax=Hymenoscyphus albidus TaxID=595503 RepID=A0A9N9M221_9HELO|nr:hypothetical protein HYALB_00001062 [Hymenoscyphus albidus]